MAQTKTQYYPFGGGLDVVTPAISVNPGRALAMQNYEPWFNGGYRRIPGFERFDGRPKPSEQTFLGFEVNASEDIVLGASLTGAPSGATGVVVGVYEDDGSRGNDMLALTKVVGTFLDGDDLGVNVTNADQQLKIDGAATDADSVLVVNNPLLIDEGIDDADGLVNDTIRNAWLALATVSWPLEDLGSEVTTINSWTLRIRARLIRKGSAIFRNNNVFAISPESDDTVTYRFTFAPGADSQIVEFTEIDAAMGFITREVTQLAAAATPAQINAELVVMTQEAFAQLGDLFDGLSLEIDAIDLVVDYDGDVVIKSDPVLRDAPTTDLEETFLLAAQDEFRGDIAVVPGSGAVRAAWQLGDVKYAIRDNVGVTAGILHLASAAGWVTAGITMADTISYDTGLAAFADVVEGDTVVGSVSGATATIHRIILNGGSGAFDGTGSGYLVVTNVVGGPFNGTETLESPALTVICTSTTANITFAFSPGGIYEFSNHNFFAGSGSLRTYGVNGVDAAFEIDENSIVSPILIPPVAELIEPTDDLPIGAPFLVEEHRNFLFHAYPGGRFVQSVVGEPINFSGFLGAAEFGAGDEITGLQSIVGNVLVITTERDARGLFGTDPSNWELRLMTEKAGGSLYSIQKVDTVYSLDDLGVTSIARTDAFGDFVGSTISQLVQPIIDAVRSIFTDSTVVRSSNQYRMYFSDATALIMYIPFLGSANQQRVQLGAKTRTNVEFGALLYPFAVSRIWNTEDATGLEQTYFITEDAGAGLGFVFQDQIGENFDGEDIISTIRLVFNQVGSPTYRKRFKQADLELNANKPLTIKFISSLTYGEEEGSIEDIDLNAGGGFWDVDNWDEFFWDGQTISTARGDLTGTGENIGFVFFHEGAITLPFTLQGLTLHYEPRRIQR